MEEARKKLRICLIFIVAVAIIIGCMYYFGEWRPREDVSEGTLVSLEIKKNTV